MTARSPEWLISAANKIVGERLRGRDPGQLERAARRWEAALSRSIDADPEADWSVPISMVLTVMGHPEGHWLEVNGAAIEVAREYGDREFLAELWVERWARLEAGAGFFEGGDR